MGCKASVKYSEDFQVLCSSKCKCKFILQLSSIYLQVVTTAQNVLCILYVNPKGIIFPFEEVRQKYNRA